MRNISFYIVFVSLILSTSNASATEPLVDSLEFNNQKGVIFPEKCCWMSIPKNERLRKLKIKGADCSAIGGPVGKFKYKDGKLWLTGLFHCEGDIELSSVYPEFKNPTQTAWITGRYKAKLGRLCKDKQGHDIYKTELQLSIKKGVVTSVTKKEFDSSACN